MNVGRAEALISLHAFQLCRLVKDHSSYSEQCVFSWCFFMPIYTFHSLHLGLGLHEDEFPLSGEGSLKSGEVLLEQPIRSGVSCQGDQNIFEVQGSFYPSDD